MIENDTVVGFDGARAQSPPVALVTGAASGIGAATCGALSAAGFAVVAADRNVIDRADVTWSVVLDVSDADAVKRAVDQVEREVGPIEALVTVAGIGGSLEIDDIDAPAWDRVNSVNLDGTFLCCQAVARRMVGRRQGTIVTIASELALLGSADFIHYCAGKGGVIGLTRALANRVADFGVSVTCVAPGLTETPMVGEPDEETAHYIDGLPIARMISAEEVADSIRFIVEHGGKWMSGRVLSPNAGAAM